MRNTSKALLALFLSLIMALIIPLQALADTPDYVSEVKVAMGSTDDLNGYIVLTNNGKPVDLNQGAGGGWGSKGDKSVYLGYKTTKLRSEAITDLALMNMKGGYETKDYEVLMQDQMDEQIIPFVENFLNAIYEYRLNYKSSNKNNRQRARYIHKALNKLIDDDTEKPLGDLLLNKTKYEMGEEAYNKLSEEEKKEHADILTIIAQSNGKATLLMENLITKASDTNSNSWIDRFCETEYSDLVKLTGVSPTDAKKKLAKSYDDDANKILEMWDTFRDELLKSDEAAENLENYEEQDVEGFEDEYKDLVESPTVDEYKDVLEEAKEMSQESSDRLNDVAIVTVSEYLASIKFGDGTLYDFFTQTKESVEEDVTVLYPLVASLSDGQRTGLDFVSLREFVMIAELNNGNYKEKEIDDLKEASIYEGVDRAIYEKGGVALTSDALRKDAALKETDLGEPTIGGLSLLFSLFASASLAGFVIALGSKIGLLIKDGPKLKAARTLLTTLDNAYTKSNAAYNTLINSYDTSRMSMGEFSKWLKTEPEVVKASKAAAEDFSKWNAQQEVVSGMVKQSSRATKMAVGLGVVFVAITAISIYLTYRDMKAHYKVDFTPVPKFMIDEKDLIGYNKKGDRIILKNQAAYYKVVECNRKENAEYYKTMGTSSDMNGDVGQQWLALYSNKNELEEPILADSFKVVVDSSQIPAGYKTGIHMFGSETAFNLNSSPYDWNKEAKSVYVYYKTDDSPSTTSTNLSAGMLALTGGCGLLAGAALSALGLIITKKKKNKAEATE